MMSAICCWKRSSVTTFQSEPLFVAPAPKDTSAIPAPPSCLERFGSYIMKAVFLAHEHLFGCKKCKKRTQNELFNLQDRHFAKCSIKTADGCILDAAIKRSTSNIKKAVLLSVGLGDQFESLADPNSYVHDVEKFVETKLGDITFMAFNVRGRRLSTGHYIPKYFHIDLWHIHQTNRKPLLKIYTNLHILACQICVD